MKKTILIEMLFKIYLLLCSCFLFSCTYTVGTLNRCDTISKETSDPDCDNFYLKYYEGIVEKSERKKRKVLPGVYLEYGYLLLKTGDKEAGRRMLMKEKMLHPSSKYFVDYLLKEF